MYRLSDKESTHIYINLAQPLAWIALKNTSENEITEALVRRAYAVVSCRNPLLRAVHKPDVSKFSLVIRDPSEVIQDEAAGKLPARLTRAFHTRDEASAEYKRKVESEVWESSFMWDVTVCVLDNEAGTDTNCVIFAYFNHGVADGAAVMESLKEFLRVLNAGLTNSASLPPHNFLGESLPVPKPFHERYPLFKFLDSASDEEKEDLFTKVSAKVKSKDYKMYPVSVDKHFSEEATQKFIAKCKRNGVSFTAGFFAAVAMAASAKKFDGTMPMSFRTKDSWGEVAVSFTDAFFTADLRSAYESAGHSDEKALWCAVSKEFHKEIRKKFASDDEKYRGLAINHVRAMLKGEECGSETSMCMGPNNDEISMCVSNVGIMDGYFVGEVGDPLTVTEVTAFCGNAIFPILAMWCYTFHGRFRVNALNASFVPRKEIFEAFTSKVFEIFESD